MSKLEDQLKELDRLRKRGRITEEEYASRRAAIIYDPTNLRPASARSSGDRRGGGLFKWGLLGCLGILAAVGVFFVIVVVVIVAALANLGKDTGDVIVRIDGSAGVGFSGSIGNLQGQRTVDGAIPASFTISGKNSGGIFTAVIRKTVSDGSLRVTLGCKGGDRTQESSAAFGVVSVSCSP
jgi:hypothetical protein